MLIIKMKYFILCVLFIAIFAQDLPPKFRLQHNAIPISYNLKIRPYIDEGFFTGEVTIFVELQKSLENITLNSKQLNISTLVLDAHIYDTYFELDPENELLNISFEDEIFIEPGEHFIFANFSGKFTNNSMGFFKSVVNSNGQNLDGVATMFSASDARSAFPCFDDPVYKSEFTVRFIIPNNTYKALSNMEEINSFKVDNGIAIDFRSTPPISPYLVCFVMTKYNYTSTVFKSSDGRIVPIRLFQLDEYKDQAPFLLEVARKSLKFFEEYTNMTYPLDKLDLIELKDFIYEGMENIGLIILTHNAVSFDRIQKMPKIEHMKDAAQLIVHEIAHMWFGDIVTHVWYNDLWITEGFAEFMEIKGVDNQYPEWKMVEIEATLRHRAVYNYDIQPKEIPPIVNFPETHQQVEDQFEDLIYSKGSAILTMLEMIMGPELFKMGVRKHLRKHYFDTSTTADFIETMQEFTPNINLWGFLTTFLYQSRYPLVVITMDNTTENYIVRQKSFFLAPDSNSIFERKWTIPITYVSNCNKSMQLKWLDKDAKELFIPRCKHEKWMKFNYEAKAYYRVLYTQNMYEQLLDHFGELNDVDRAQLIDEVFHLMRKLQVSCEFPMKFIGKLKEINGFLSILVGVKAIKRTLTDMKDETITLQKFKKYVINIFEKYYEKLTWIVDTKDNFNISMLRANIFEMLCVSPLKYDKCIKDVENIGKTGLEIHPDLFSIFNQVLEETEYPEPETNKTVLATIAEKILSNVTKSKEIYLKSCKSWLIENI